jgi:peptide/nickel transport system ATP-binding protein
MTETDRQPILTIEDLTVAYRHGNAWQDAVRDFSLRIEPGQMVGLVGESGSGKSTIALAIMRTLSRDGKVRQGRISFAGDDLLSMDEPELRQIWGKKLALVPQDPLSALNPSIQVGEQVAELLRHQLDFSRARADDRALELLRIVRIPDPERIFKSYPHQISGGMQQRILIAMALSTEPGLLVLDEPTTALDVTTQAAILDLIQELIKGRETGSLYVTHNLGVVARICDRVAVLYAGELVEEADTDSLFRDPLHPYTRGLMDSVPRLGSNKRRSQLRAIPGQIPALGDRSSGCVFAPRCPLALELCYQERPPMENSSNGHRIRCHRWPEILAGQITIQESEVKKKQDKAQDNGQTGRPLLALDDLRVYYPIRRSIGDALAGRPVKHVKAVDGVDLTLSKGNTLGLVGESGSGKTSLARAIIGLEKTSGGTMDLLDICLPSGLSKRTREIMQHLQIVFQNPEEALNPYLTVAETLRRPLMTLGGLSREQTDKAIPQLLADVRLPAEYAQRRPGQLSGGEKQRVAIARAFAANPDLLLFDEPVSSLDVSVQASILNLLNELQAQRGIGNLFISHDLAVVGYLSDVIAVIYAGNLVEVARAEELFVPPYHPYTEALLSAIPVADPGAEQARIRLEGDVPNQIDLPDGCLFHPRCPRFLGEICAVQQPPWQESGTGKRILCHITSEELMEVQRG